MLKRLVVNKLGSDFAKFANNSFWLFLEKILRMGIELFVSIWLARYLGVKDFGLFNYSIAFVDLFAPLYHLGLPGVVVRDLVTKEEIRNKILGTAFALKLAGGTIVLCLATTTIFMVRPGDTLSCSLIVVIAIGKICNSFETLDFWFQSQMQSKYIAVSKTVAFILASFCKIFLIIFHAPLIAFAAIATIEIALSSIGLIFSYIKCGFSFKSWQPSFIYAKEMLYECCPNLLTTAAIVIQARIDQAMLGQMIGDGEVGQYSVAMRLIEAFAFLPSILCQSLFPLISKSKLHSEEIYFKHLTNTYRLMFIVFILAAVPIFLFSQSIVLMLYGQEYKTASYLLPLFSIRLFFANMGIAKSIFIVNNSLFVFSLFAAISGSLTNVVLNLVLIPHFASIGALWATIISFTISVFIVDIFNPKMYKNSRAMLKGIFTPYKISLKL